MKYNTVNHTIERDDGQPFATLDKSVTTKEAYDAADSLSGDQIEALLEQIDELNVDNQELTTSFFNFRAGALRAKEINDELRSKIADIKKEHDDLQAKLGSAEEKLGEAEELAAEFAENQDRATP